MASPGYCLTPEVVIPMVGQLPTKVNLDIYQGDDFYMTMRINDGAGEPVDLTGWTARSQIRTTAASSTILASFTCTVTDSGEVNAHLPAAVTKGLAPGTAVWDFELTDPSGSGNVTTLCAGTVTISAEVTR